MQLISSFANSLLTLYDQFIYLFWSRDNAVHPKGICGQGKTKEKKKASGRPRSVRSNKWNPSPSTVYNQLRELLENMVVEANNSVEHPTPFAVTNNYRYCQVAMSFGNTQSSCRGVLCGLQVKILYLNS